MPYAGIRTRVSLASASPPCQRRAPALKQREPSGNLFRVRAESFAAMIDLRGRVALVVGASGGIGSHVAEVLAECGADLVLAYHSNRSRAEEVATTIQVMGRRGVLHKVDATDVSAANALVTDALHAFGQIDILANCCGWNGAFQLFKDQDPTLWRQIIAVELTACLNLSHAVLENMIAKRSGRIITLASESGKAGLSGSAVSSAARGGVIAFSKSLAREVGRHAITVNVVCPGPTETPVLEMLRQQGATGQRLIEGLVASIPMKRVGLPREIASTIAFLASQEAGFITGQAISVSGGLTMT